MTNTETALSMLDSRTVYTAYTGRTGCMCGCRGNYAYCTEHVAEAGKLRGYSLGSEEISDRKVNGRTKKLRALITSGDFSELFVDDTKCGYVCVQHGQHGNERVLAVFFLPKESH